MKTLNGLVNKAKELQIVKGVKVGKSNLSLEVSRLFFADDTLIFCQPNVRNLLHLRCVLLYFHGVSGLKINLQKTELVRVGSNGDGRQFTSMLESKAVSLPIKYLSLPLGAKYKNKATWEPVVKMFERRLTSWKINFLSKGDRLTLIKSPMAHLPIYYLSTFTVPVSIAKKLEVSQCKFLWNDDEENWKFQLVKWEHIKRPLKQGGLGIRSMVAYEVLQGKWLWRFLVEENRL